MGGSKKRHPAAQRERARTDQISTAVRLILLVWEIVSTLVREHVLRGAGPWRLL